METLVGYDANGKEKEVCTDPTYKEWKPVEWIALHNLIEAAHGSYLQGMETRRNRRQYRVSSTHGSYLQGMETDRGVVWADKLLGTDPTYKEWKRM